MVIMKRRLGGVEYLYASVEQRQIYLGRADSPGGADQKKLADAAARTDRAFRKALDRYSRDVRAYAALMDEPARGEYLRGRRRLLAAEAGRLGGRRP